MPINATSDRSNSQRPLAVSPAPVKSTPLKSNAVNPDYQDERSRFQFYRVGKLTKHLEATAWLIDDYIETDSLTLCFAPPESFKLTDLRQSRRLIRLRPRRAFIAPEGAFTNQDHTDLDFHRSFLDLGYKP